MLNVSLYELSPSFSSSVLVFAKLWPVVRETAIIIISLILTPLELLPSIHKYRITEPPFFIALNNYVQINGTKPFDHGIPANLETIVWTTAMHQIQLRINWLTRFT